jgi:iron complex outermembrane receptor protein
MVWKPQLSARLCGSSILLGCIAAHPTFALAQENANRTAQARSGQDAPSAVQEVVVTAQLRRESLVRVPQPVQAIQGRTLEREGISDFKQIIDMVPGASEASEIAPGSEVLQIRGVTPGQSAGDATIGYYLDNFAFSIPGVPVAPTSGLYDLDRVEVIRGPSGTLYGQGSLGGTVKVVTNDPVFNKFEGSYLFSASATDGGGPNGTADFMLNLPLVEDKLAIRGVFEYGHIGGYAYYPLYNDQRAGNYANEYTGRVKILAQPTDKMKIVISYVQNYVPQNHSNEIDQINPPVSDDQAGGTVTEYSLYTGDIHYDLDFADFLSSTGYLNQRGVIAGQGDTPVTGSYNVDTSSRDHAIEQEFRLTSKAGGLINWTVGAFYRDADYISANNVSVQLPVPILVLGQDKTTSQAWAVYGEVSANLLGGLIVPTFGGRYYSDDRRLTENSENIISGSPPTILGPFLDSVSGHDSAFSPRFNLAFHPSADSTVYVEVAKGFRSGVIQGHGIASALEALGVQASPSLGPDTLWNYEVGAKWRMFDRRLQFDVALYQFDWSNAQFQISPAGNVSGVVDVGDVRGRGVDVSATYKPIDGLTLEVTGNLNSTVLQKVPHAVTESTPLFVDGVQAPGTPRGNVSAVVDYVRPLGNGWSLLANLRYLYRGAQKDLVYGEESGELSEGFLRVGVDTGHHVRAYIFADNITNDRGPASISYGRYVIPYPRTVGISLQGTF